MPERLAQLAYDDLPPAVQPLADGILKVSGAALWRPVQRAAAQPGHGAARLLA